MLTLFLLADSQGADCNKRRFMRSYWIAETSHGCGNSPVWAVRFDGSRESTGQVLNALGLCLTRLLVQMSRLICL